MGPKNRRHNVFVNDNGSSRNGKSTNRTEKPKQEPAVSERLQPRSSTCNTEMNTDTRTKEEDESHYSTAFMLLCALCCGLLNVLHTSMLFEKHHQFSHLSTIEREIIFRTEMGFYYSHYKTVVEAETLLAGVARLVHNNSTEHPDIINSLQRFNIMPEVVMAVMYHGMMRVADWAGVSLQVCYVVDRGQDLPPVLSCDGLGDPAGFYVSCAWLMAGFTGALVFVSGATLSRNLLGGFVSIACFFFNHAEATRVMWSPPLRETFAFPFSLLINIIVVWILRKPTPHYKQPVCLSVITYAYLVSWQFSQYTLLISVMIVYFMHSIELIRPLPMLLVLMGCIFGFLNCLVTMFFNQMLMTSYLAACLLAMFLMYVFLENVFNWFPPPINKSIQLAFILLSTIGVKAELTNLLGGDEDSHIYNLLRSKFTNYSDFHTLLYTCSPEFDFLPAVTVINLSKTFLIPTVFVVVGATCTNMFKIIKDNLMKCFVDKTDILRSVWKGIDPGIVYQLIMLVAYFILSGLVMRLKLFLTPQLCIVASLVTCRKFFKAVPSRQFHYGALAVLIAVMAIKGFRNIVDQRSTAPSVSNQNLEELIEWINTETTSNAVFAGPMPTTASIMLSTRRPVVNHPHYETDGIRKRTKDVYSVYSRRSPQIVYETLVRLKVNYLVLEESHCFYRNKPGCSMVDLWDIDEPKNKHKKPLCPKLYYQSPSPFHKVFDNDGYVVLQVPSKYIQIPPPKSLQS